MSDLISLTCPRCQHTWERALRDLERVDKIYRGIHSVSQPAPGTARTASYRDQCPACGIYVIIAVQEE